MSVMVGRLGLILAIGLSACTGSTEFGECIGLDDKENEQLRYEFSTRNAVWSAIGIELVVPPVLWVFEYAKCPVGRVVK